MPYIPIQINKFKDAAHGKRCINSKGDFVPLSVLTTIIILNPFKQKKKQ